MKKLVGFFIALFLSFSLHAEDSNEEPYSFEGYYSTEIKLPEGVLKHKYNVDFTHYGFWFGLDRFDYYKIIEKKPSIFDIYYYSKALYFAEDGKCSDIEVLDDKYCVQKIELDTRNPENYVLRTIDKKIFFLKRSHRFDKENN